MKTDFQNNETHPVIKPKEIKLGDTVNINWLQIGLVRSNATLTQVGQSLKFDIGGETVMIIDKDYYEKTFNQRVV